MEAFAVMVYDLLLEILGRADVLIGLFAMVGLIAQRKTISEVISGTVKTVMGFLLIGVAIGTVYGAMYPIGGMIEEGIEIAGVMAQHETFLGIMTTQFSQYMSSAAVILILSFGVNLILARFTPLKFVYLSTHLTWYYAPYIVLLIDRLTPLGTGIGGTILAGVILGIYNTLQPWYLWKYAKKVTGNAFSLAHDSSIHAFIGGWIGEKVGDPSDSMEKFKLPESLEFLKDPTISTALATTIVTLVFSLLAGLSVAQEWAGGTNLILWAIFQGLYFGAGISVLLMGVRMLIAELVPAFKGISDKIVPGAVPALDCPAFLPYGAVSWTVTFLGSYLFQYACLFLMLGLQFPRLVIPSIDNAFFEQAPGGVFANKLGGKKGVIVALFVNGLIFTFTQLVMWSLIGYDIRFVLGGDGTTWFAAIGYILKMFGGVFGGGG